VTEPVDSRDLPTRSELALAFLIAMGVLALSVALYLKGQLG
jgi:hypothetical protein